eukprot:11835095-Heterocapsa_arctica.AAC.1
MSLHWANPYPRQPQGWRAPLTGRELMGGFLGRAAGTHKSGGIIWRMSVSSGLALSPHLPLPFRREVRMGNGPPMRLLIRLQTKRSSGMPLRCR